MMSDQVPQCFARYIIMKARLNTNSWFEESKCGCQDFYLKSLKLIGQAPSQVDLFAEGTSSKQPIFVEF